MPPMFCPTSEDIRRCRNRRRRHGSCSATPRMGPFVNVRFQGMPLDPSLEAAVHRWVARLEWTAIEIHRAEVLIERAGRRRTVVRVSIGPVTGVAPTASTSHVDAYVAVSN